MADNKIDIPGELSDYVKLRDEEICVDWEGLGRLKKKVPYGIIDFESFNSIFDSVLEHLLEIKVLTFGRKNCWRIVSFGDDGPKTSYGQDYMRFTKEEDAKGYFDAFHRDTRYSIAIERLD